MVLKGTVVAVALNAKYEFGKSVRNCITLVKERGVEGDAHAGRFVQHRYLAKKMPALPNSRQVHLIASELFMELASRGFNVAPGDLGENVTTAGLDLTNLPLGTRLQIGNSAIVEPTRVRKPSYMISSFQKGLK